MEAKKIQIKFYADGLKVDSIDEFVPVFHRWIRDRVLGDELVIDVADYSHVHEGPGVVLVGHGADYYVDCGEGRPGLLFSRKRALPEGVDILSDAIESAKKAAALLADAGELGQKPSFGTSEILIRIPDRLAVKNDDESFEAVKPEVASALAQAFSKDYQLTREGGPLEPLTIRARA